MDRVLKKFEKLFSIRFAHEAFPFSASNGGILSQHISIEPDQATSKIFNQHDILIRKKNDLLICLVRVQPAADIPFFLLPNNFSARFFINLANPLKDQTDKADSHGKENMYRFRINVRASANSMSLSEATLGPLESREPERIFTPGNPGTWTTQAVNLSGHFGVIDLVTEGSSTHRLYTDVANQNLFYTEANGNENEHLFTIHLNN